MRRWRAKVSKEEGGDWGRWRAIGSKRRVEMGEVEGRYLRKRWRLGMG